MENENEKNSDSMFNEPSGSEASSMFDDNIKEDSSASMFDDALKSDEKQEEIKEEVKAAPEKTEELEKTEEPVTENKTGGEDIQKTPEEKTPPAAVDTEDKEKNDNLSSIVEDEDSENTSSLVTVRPVKFKEFEETPPNHIVKKNYDIMLDVPLHISVELGRTKSTIKDVIDLTKGSIVELNKIAGEQVEIFVNDKFVAKGEVIVIEDKFGVRVTNTNIQKSPANL